MKKNLFILCILSTSAYASDYTKNDNRDVYDLMYLPAANTIFGETGLSASSASADVKLNGNKYGKIDVTSSSANQTLGYSLTDRLSFHTSIDYLLKNESVFDPETGDDQKSQSKGLGDPSLGARFRILEQKNSGLNLDIIPAYSFNSGDSETNSNTNENNNKQGGTVYDLHLEGGMKFTDLQVAVNLGWTHENKSKTKDTTDGDKTTKTQNDTLSLQVLLQKLMNEQFYFNFGGGLSVASAVSDKDENGVTTKTPSLTTIQVTGQAGWNFSKNLTALGTLHAGSVADYTSKDSSGNKIMYENFGFARIGASLRYQF